MTERVATHPRTLPIYPATPGLNELQVTKFIMKLNWFGVNRVFLRRTHSLRCVGVPAVTSCPAQKGIAADTHLLGVGALGVCLEPRFELRRGGNAVDAHRHEQHLGQPWARGLLLRRILSIHRR